MFRSKNAKNRAADGSPIVESRVAIRASDSSIERTVTNAVVYTKDGKVGMVPVNSEGRVPEEALVRRFLNTSVGPRGKGVRRLGADMRRTSRKVHGVPEGGFTPTQIIDSGWWDDPGKSDVEGIDDGYGAMLDFGPGMGKLERATGGRMAIIAPTEAEKRRIAAVLDENFTGAEMKAAAWKYGLIIRVGKPVRNALGHYEARQSGVSTPEIVLRPNSSDETIIHEMVHHLRAVDPSRTGLTKTPFNIDADGREVPSYFQSDYDSRVTLEEAGTVAETTGRTKGMDRTISGYYWKIPKQLDPQACFRHDRELLTGGVGKESRPKSGKRLMDAVEENFDDTTISRLRYKGRKSAMGYVRQLREEERLPERRKPAKKPAAKKATSSKKPKTEEDEWIDAFLSGKDPWARTGGGRKR